MIDFAQFEEKARRYRLKNRAPKLANNTYLIVREDGGYGIKLHNTEVIIHYADRLILNSGGWQTVTTKERMNRFSRAHVWSDKGVWIVDWHAHQYAFADQIELFTDGRVNGFGTDPKETQKLRKKVKTFAKEYATAFCAGKVPAPSGGDCWACSMVSKEGIAPMGGPDHILSHLEENYFVPAMLTRMADAGTLSVYAKNFIYETWKGENPIEVRRINSDFSSVAVDQIRKTVQKFCFQELRLAR